MKALRVLFRLGLMIGFGLAMPGTPTTAQTTSPKEAQPAASGLRKLTGEDEKRAKQLDEQIDQATKADRWDEAIARAEELLALRTRAQGPKHFETVNAEWRIKTLRRLASMSDEDRVACQSADTMKARSEPLVAQGKYAQAQPLFEKALEIRRRLFTDDHPDTADDYNNVANSLNAQGKYAEAEALWRKALAIRLKALGEEHPETARIYANVAFSRGAQGKYVEAETLNRKALAIMLKALGEDDPDAALSYNSVAYNLHMQGKFAEAELLYRKALAIWIKTRGENHTNAAGIYNSLAAVLSAQGKYAAAEPVSRKALAIRLEVLGENQADTANCYNNLAAILDAQGKYAESEPLYREALAIRLKAQGENHHHTALSYNNLGYNLDAQGKYAEAEPLYRKALAILLKALGENHPDTASIYASLGSSLNAQGKYAEAEPLYRTALAIRLKALGESHPSTAQSYNNVASNLHAQEKYIEAEALYRQALAIRLKALGENHPDTARSYNLVASSLDAQGKYAEAEPLSRQALAVRLKALGENHPDTGGSYNRLANNLDAQGRLTEALANWTAAAAIYDRTRGAQSASGLERSMAPLGSPLPALAVALARQGQFRAAWARWEADLARGLLDDLSARQLRPLTDDQRRREAGLASQLQRLDERIARLASKGRRTQDEDQQLDALRGQQNTLRGQWVEFQNALEREYQAAAGKPSSLEETEKALPGDAALVGWLDVGRHHWACIVRHEGDPAWVKIPGSGQDGAWTKEDDERPQAVRAAVAGHQPGWSTPADGSSRAKGAAGRPPAEHQPTSGATAEALARQRLAPLFPHLKGVTHLIILPSQALAGVPIEALVATLPAGVPRPIVSYAPSGSMFVRLTAPRSRPSGSPRLLALGDPAFPKPAPGEPPPSPPDHGIAIVAVAPQSAADLFGIKAGDVLLEYNGKVLKTPSDLAIIPAEDKPIRVPIKLWRDGEIRSLEIAAGRLGIQSNPNRPAAQAVLAQRAAAEVLKPGIRGEDLAPLPGTRREVQAIAALFPNDQVTTLLGSDAAESKLQELARSGALKSYRFLHLATHGKANPSVALSSAIFLATEPERPATLSADPAALESAPDGQVTAEQIVRTWDLDADLVVLSACESGLGRYAGGEGYLGFAQALFVKGARSLVLSQWRVDDKATALLMTRFYQNLLGKRRGLSKPMPKALALQEAKQWLRSLTVDQVGAELTALERGDVRPLAKVDGGTAPGAATSPKPSGNRPYDHPYYWAAFVLVGDPD
ncbi:MAG: tetratricopeptide repeat protein [Isosphaeraceae bacterium]